MAKILLIVFIIPLLLQIKCKQQNPPPTLIDICKKELIKVETILWKDIVSTNTNEVMETKETSPEVIVIGELEKFGDNLQDNFSRISNDDNLVVLNTVPLWKEVESLLKSVDNLYGSFRRFQRQQTTEGRIPSPKQAWIDFTDTILSHQTYSIPNVLDKIGNYIKKGQLFDVILKEMDSNSVCMSRQSPNQLLYNLYNMISLTQMKGYAMMQFSYMLLEMYGKGSFSSESQLAREKYINRSIEAAEAMKNAMDRASTQLWRCDPEKFERGVNYLEVTQLLQGYIQNEVDLNSDGTCKENCGYYQYTKSHSCYENLYCRQQRRCKGRIFNCQYIDSDMWVCPSDANSGRRYKYVEYENGRILGQKGSCPNKRVKVDSWWRWIFWHCSYCLCLCDEEGIYSDRYFSLRQSVSNVTANRVITGLRFTKKNRILHLQVQQGELLPYGVINDTTLEWVPVDDMKISDRFVYNRQDYFTLNWENRALDLDVLQGESGGPQKDGSVLTGVRFKIIGSHLNFEIRVTPFDFETGKLITPRQSSEWIDNVNTEFSPEKRTKINIGKVDVPTKTKAPSQIRSNHNQFIEFTHTDYDVDAAQTTVPFLDSQNVIPLIPMPISGAGIYFKSVENHGGFIGLKLVTYNFSKHLNFTLNENEVSPVPEIEPLSN